MDLERLERIQANLINHKYLKIVASIVSYYFSFNISSIISKQINVEGTIKLFSFNLINSFNENHYSLFSNLLTSNYLTQ